MAKLGWVHVVTEGNLSLLKSTKCIRVYLEDPDTGMRTALKDFLVRRELRCMTTKNVKKGDLVFAFANRVWGVFANSKH